MKLIYAFLVLLALPACTKQVKLNSPIEQTQNYALTQNADSKESESFIIYARGVAEARDVANSRLNCRKQVCEMTPGGVILFVDRPKIKPVGRTSNQRP